MKKSTPIWIALLLVMLLSAGPHRLTSGYAGNLSPDDPPVDGYGYVLSTAVDSWLEANTGTYSTVPFPTRDDAFAGPFGLGFNFRFYENTFSQFYVSTNGMITFGSGSSSSWARPIPFPPAPNSLIAPLWSDLNLAFGDVYYRVHGSVPNRILIIEWEIFSDETRSQLVTNFEILLHENGGAVVFQYHVLNVLHFPDWYSVGIEDANGINGLQFTDSLQVGTALVFNRPPASCRVNVIPRFQGGFTSQNQAYYELQIVNNGELGTDTFNLQAASSNPDWTIEMVDSTGLALTDTTSDGLVDTGLVQQGAYKIIRVKASVPASAPAGSGVSVLVTATSVAAPTQTIVATVQSALPVPFTQLYVDSTGIRLGQFWEENTITYPVLNGFTGANLSLKAVPGERYLAAWEFLSTVARDGTVYKGVTRLKDGGLIYQGKPLEADLTDQYTEIQYRLVHRTRGAWTEPVNTMTNSWLVVGEPDVIQADARSPAIATAADGKIALVWSMLRRKYTTYYETNSNIYLGILNSQGIKMFSDAFNVTADQPYWTVSHQYDFPSVAVTGDLKYVVCWIQQFDAKVRCGFHTVSTQSISQLGSLLLVSDAPPGAQPLDLSMSALANNRVILTYSEAYENAPSNVVYVILKSDGTFHMTRTVIGNGYGREARTVQFPNGNILVAWVAEDGRIGYQLLNPSGNATLPNPSYLEKVNQRNGGSLSATLDASGRAVLTWADSDDFDALFYALLQADGSVLTAPTMFVSAPLSDPMYQTSDFGFGSAAYNGVYQSFLPVMRR